ncbi:MAG TPA: sigma-70 family RNA polymerase sigma factor [Kofleriaceae bacterium]|jgi:RNA polymerase sigma-70 factor (ECF subfamily)
MELEKLMSELSWLERLARALVRDESDARDLVQDTWLVAAEHAPTDGRPLKPWLSRVALNLVRMRSRASTRRLAREAAVEPSAESPTPDELVSRVRAQRLVADEVLALAEPYRTTILLHFFEDLSSAEIARRTGTPEGTVRRRLKTALDELRARLHADERKTGRAVVTVLAGRAALGALLVKKVIAAVVVIAALIVLGTQLYKHRAQPSEPVAAAPGSNAAVAPAKPAVARAAHVVVTVTDVAGPVANAFVRCAPSDGDVVVAKTAGDGSVSIELAAGPWSIAASADKHEPAAVALVVTPGRDDRVTLVLASGGELLTGIVTDVTGGVVAGARVDAARLDRDAKTGRAVAVAFTDRAGRYSLVVGAGEVLVAASHPEYAPQTRYVDLGSTGATANFALAPGGVIEGVVRDVHTKQPVAGASVHASSDSVLELAAQGERIVKTDDAGKFRFAGLGPGAYQLAAEVGARRSRVPVGVEVGVAEQQADIVVLVDAMATIHGTVVDDTGAAAPGVTVRASGDADESETTADAAGAFAFEGLAPNRWALSGTSDRYLPDGQAIVPLAKRDVDGIVVRVRRGLEANGHVEPREVCDVEIAKQELRDPLARRDSMTTAADGVFHFAPFGPGTATLVAHCPSGDQGTVAVAVGADELVVPVVPGGSITGRVVDTAGAPVPGVMVNAELATEQTRFENGALASGYKGTTSSTGVFEIGSLGAASYRLSVLDIGQPLRPTKAVKVALSMGQHATGIEIVVERPTGVIRGTVTGPDGVPVADAWVRVHQSVFDRFAALNNGEGTLSFDGEGLDGGTHDAPAAMTDARGRFEMTSLVRGKYQVFADAQSGKLRGGAADVTTDADIAIHLAAVSALSGTVHGPSGPTDLFTIRLTGPTGQVGAFTDGAFRFPRLDPGDYTIDAESTDGTGTAKAHVSSDAAASVDIALVANGTITGRLVDEAGKPVSGIGVALIPDQAPGQLMIALHALPPTSGPDGRFTVEGSPGVHTLVILGQKPTPKRGVTVTSGVSIDVGDLTPL